MLSWVVLSSSTNLFLSVGLNKGAMNTTWKTRMHLTSGAFEFVGILPFSFL